VHPKRTAVRGERHENAPSTNIGSISGGRVSTASTAASPARIGRGREVPAMAQTASVVHIAAGTSLIGWML
jgi:hypothetical protein